MEKKMKRMNEINNDFYCPRYCPHGYCLEGMNEYEREYNCGNCILKRRKWPTPEQFKQEYGFKYPDLAACFIRSKNNMNREIYDWGVTIYRQHLNEKDVEIVCACTLWGCPPIDWKPEKEITSEIKQQIDQMISEGENGFKPKKDYGKYICQKRVEKGLTFRQVYGMGGAHPFVQSAIELEKTNGFSLHDLRITLEALEIKPNEIFE